jgi:glycosyltransferase involved in cell wall biosynthesis
MNVLYISYNIPTPKTKGNKIVFAIAENMSQFCEISFVYPAPFVFPPFSFLPKYKQFVRIKPWKEGKFEIKPAKYLRLPGKKLSYLLLSKINPDNYLDESKLPDLCHAHFVMPDGYFALRAKQKFGVPYVVSVRSSDLEHIKMLNSKGIVFQKFMSVFKNANQIIVHNRPQREFIKSLGFDSVMIAHGIDDKILNKSQKKTDNKVVISVVAEMIARKNIDWVIHAVKEYVGKEIIELIIIGDGVCKERHHLLAGNATNIHFLGKQPHTEVISLLKKSDIFALPSYRETFGLVYLEAAANNNAVICHKNEGVDGLFEDEKEIFLCNGYDNFKEILYELIENHDKRKIVSDGGYERAKNYTWQRVTTEYLKIYEQVLGNAMHENFRAIGL